MKEEWERVGHIVKSYSALVLKCITFKLLLVNMNITKTIQPMPSAGMCLHKPRGKRSEKQ